MSWEAHHKDALKKRFNELPMKRSSKDIRKKLLEKYGKLNEGSKYEKYLNDHLKDHADYKNYDKITRLTIMKNIREILKKSE